MPRNEHGHDDRLARTGGHLEGGAGQAGVGGIVGGPKLVLDPRVAVVFRDLGQIDSRFESFDLAEEQLLLTVGVGPVGQQAARGGRHADVAAFPPKRHAGADLVDEFVLLDPVLGPFGVEDKLLLPFLTGLGDGDKIRAASAPIDDLIGDPLVGELEVPARLPERRIDNRILNDYLSHDAQISLNIRNSNSRRAILRRATASQACHSFEIRPHPTPCHGPEQGKTGKVGRDR